MANRSLSEHGEALRHLDFAIAEFREMKGQPSLEKATGSRLAQTS